MSGTQGTYTVWHKAVEMFKYFLTNVTEAEMEAQELYDFAINRTVAGTMTLLQVHVPAKGIHICQKINLLDLRSNRNKRRIKQLYA